MNDLLHPGPDMGGRISIFTFASRMVVVQQWFSAKSSPGWQILKLDLFTCVCRHRTAPAYELSFIPRRMNSAASPRPAPARESAPVSQTEDACLRPAALPASPVFSVCSRAAVFPPRAPAMRSSPFCPGSTGSGAGQTETRDRGLPPIPCGISSSPGLMVTPQRSVLGTGTPRGVGVGSWPHCCSRHRLLTVPVGPQS